ncbi:MAG: hypothetical protein AAB649_03795, partial [Patescibacteria group bacterium]
DSSALMFVSGKGTTPGEGFLPVNPVGSQLYIKNRDTKDLFTSPPSKSETEHYLNSTYTPADFLKDQAKYISIENPTEYIIDDKISASIEKIRPGCGGMEICLPLKHRIILKKDGQQYKHPIARGSRWSHSGEISNLILSPDKKHIAYIVKNRGLLLMVGNINGENTTRGKEYDSIVLDSIRFSDDGKYIGYGATRNQKIYWVVEEIAK